MVGVVLLAAAGTAVGIPRRLHLGTGAHRLQGRHRDRDRRRPVAQAARHPRRQRHLPAESRRACATPAGRLGGDAGAGSCAAGAHRRPRAIPAEVAGAAGRRGGGNRRIGISWTRAARRRAGRTDSTGTSTASAARRAPCRHALAGSGGHLAHELRRDHRRGSGIRPRWGASADPEPGANGHRAGEPRGQRLPQHAVGRRHVADGGQPRRGSADAGVGPGDRGGGAGDAALPGFRRRAPAACGAGRRRHRHHRGPVQAG